MQKGVEESQTGCMEELQDGLQIQNSLTVKCVHLARWIIPTASSPIFSPPVLPILLTPPTPLFSTPPSSALRVKFKLLSSVLPKFFFSYFLAHIKIITFMWCTVGRLLVAEDPGHFRPHLAVSRAEVIQILDTHLTQSHTTKWKALP